MFKIQFQLELENCNKVNNYVLQWKENSRSRWFHKVLQNKQQDNIVYFEITTTSKKILYKYLDQENTQHKKRYQTLIINQLNYLQKDTWNKKNIQIELNYLNQSFIKNTFISQIKDKQDTLLDFKQGSSSWISELVKLDENDEKISLKIEYLQENELNQYTIVFDVSLKQRNIQRYANVTRLIFDEQDILNLIQIKNLKEKYQISSNIQIYNIKFHEQKIDDYMVFDKFHFQLQQFEKQHYMIDQVLQEHLKTIQEIPKQLEYQFKKDFDNYKNQMKQVNNYFNTFQNQSLTQGLEIQGSKMQMQQVINSVKLPRIHSQINLDIKPLLKGSEKNSHQMKQIDLKTLEKMKHHQTMIKNISLQNEIQQQKQLIQKQNQNINSNTQRIHTLQGNVDDQLQVSMVVSKIKQSVSNLEKIQEQHIKDYAETQKFLEKQIVKLKFEIKQLRIANEEQKNINMNYLKRIISLVRQLKFRRQNCFKIEEQVNDNDKKSHKTECQISRVINNLMLNTSIFKEQKQQPAFLDPDDVRNPMFDITNNFEEQIQSLDNIQIDHYNQSFNSINLNEYTH